MPAVLQGGLPTVSGFGKLSAVEATVVEQELADLVRAIPAPVVVHCCAPRVPLELFRAAGAAALSFDLGLVQDLDAVGTAIEAGHPPVPRRRPGHRQRRSRRRRRRRPECRPGGGSSASRPTISPPPSP